jgi:hypothetical protein
VTLDATDVKGSIRSYEWELRLGNDCPEEVVLAEKKLTGRRQSFVALCSVHATLTVKDACGKRSSSKTTAAVTPRRGFTTTVRHQGTAELDAALVVGQLAFGRNVCAIDGVTGAQTSGHFLHRGGDKPTSGYAYAMVKSGPFRGNWYVTRYTSLVRRTSLISKDLSPAGELYRVNVAAGNGADIAALRASVVDHERLHTTLVEEQVRRADRAKEVEAMVYPNETRLIAFVGAKLSDFEEELQAASRDANVKKRMSSKWSRPATILVRDGTPGGFTSRTFPSLADIGDESF